MPDPNDGLRAPDRPTGSDGSSLSDSPSDRFSVLTSGCSPDRLRPSRHWAQGFDHASHAVPVLSPSASSARRSGPASVRTRARRARLRRHSLRRLLGPCRRLIVAALPVSRSAPVIVSTGSDCSLDDVDWGWDRTSPLTWGDAHVSSSIGAGSSSLRDVTWTAAQWSAHIVGAPPVSSRRSRHPRANVRAVRDIGIMRGLVFIGDLGLVSSTASSARATIFLVSDPDLVRGGVGSTLTSGSTVRSGADAAEVRSRPFRFGWALTWGTLVWASVTGRPLGANGLHLFRRRL